MSEKQQVWLPEVIGDWRQIAWNPDKEKWYGFEALNYIIDNGGMFQAITPNKIRMTDIDSSKDLSMVNKIL